MTKEKFTFTLFDLDGHFLDIQTVVAEDSDKALDLLRKGGFVDNGVHVVPGFVNGVTQ